MVTAQIVGYVLTLALYALPLAAFFTWLRRHQQQRRRFAA